MKPADSRPRLVIGAPGKLAAYPSEDKCTVENLAAKMFNALGIPRHHQWQDIDGRPREMFGLF